jgi:sarcosine oxidase subunit beta
MAFPWWVLWRKSAAIFVAIGLCGQGVMLGPAIGELLSRLVLNRLTRDDLLVLEKLSPNRSFQVQEVLR